MIYRFQPFSDTKNLGKAYNDHIKLTPDNSWICLQDYDTCFLDSGFYKNMMAYILRYPEQGIFTCYTNRTLCKEQQFRGQIFDNPNMDHWRNISKEVHSKPMALKDINKEISGFCILFNKDKWKEVGGFMEREGRCLGIDNNFCWTILKKGYKIGLMENVFCVHYYRLVEGIKYKDHLK